VAFTDAQAAMAFALELEDKRNVVFKKRYPSLSDYDAGGGFSLNPVQDAIRESDLEDGDGEDSA